MATSAVPTDNKKSMLDDALNKYLNNNLKVSEIKKVKKLVEKVVRDVMSRVESKDARFKMGLEYRGSVYEKVKIKEADEFDFDLKISQLALEEAPKKRLADVPLEYTVYTLKPSLQEAWKNLADAEGNLLSAERVVQRFSSLVSQAITDLNQEGEHKPLQFGFKTNHPAVTIIFKRDGKILHDVDLAPVIEIKKWPDTLTIGWETRKKKGWPSTAIIETIKKTSVYLVPKLYKDQFHEKRDYLWRYAFNKAEKKLLLDSESDMDNNCRRPVLRILKGLLTDFQWPGLRSYHIKTTLLHEFETWADKDHWKQGDLGERVKSAVRRLQGSLAAKEPKLKHYFLPSINVLEGVNEEQRKQILESIKIFLDNPCAAVSKLTQGPSVQNGKKQKAEACKPYISLLQDFMQEVRSTAAKEKNEAILKICQQFQEERFAQLGIKDKSHL